MEQPTLSLAAPKSLIKRKHSYTDKGENKNFSFLL